MVAMAKLTFIAAVLATFPAFGESQLVVKDVVDVVKSLSLKSIEIPLNSQNCAPTLRARQIKGQAECFVDIREAVKPLVDAGYEYGHLDYRDAGGNFESEKMHTLAQGWAFNFDKMMITLMAKNSFKLTEEEVKEVIETSLASGQLKVRLTFNKLTCTRNGKEVRVNDCRI